MLVLGVISAVRPATSQAAIFALLRAPAPARTLLAFTSAGFAFSVTVGVLVAVAFDGVGGAVGRPTFAAVFDLVAGIAALGFAAGVARNGFSRGPKRQHGRATSAITERLHRPSVATAAAAGIATHVPGLIYLVALNSIAAGGPGAVEAAAQVVIYNLLWFALPLGALVLSIRSPQTADAYLDRLSAWARRNQEPILVVLFGALGVYLVAKGVYALVS